MSVMNSSSGGFRNGSTSFESGGLSDLGLFARAGENRSWNCYRLVSTEEDGAPWTELTGSPSHRKIDTFVA